LAGIIIIEAASLTLVVVVGLTLYTFWAAKRGHDFSFLGPFLAAACLILMLYWLAQVGRPDHHLCSSRFSEPRDCSKPAMAVSLNLN